MNKDYKQNQMIGPVEAVGGRTSETYTIRHAGAPQLAQAG